MSIQPNLSREALPPQEQDYSAWYNDAIRQGGLIDEGVTPGTWALLPAATRSWNNIRMQMTEAMDAEGVEEVTFPTLFPYSLLANEAEHVEGFAPEVYMATHAGGKELDEPLVLRPTSEVVVSEYFKRWIQSYRDLPIQINQWGSVFRAEKRPRPFLRTTEFMWQEGHSAHATAAGADAQAAKMAEMYHDFMERNLSIYGFSGKKSDNERFAGAVATRTLEAVYGGRALQLATAHDLSDTFSRAHDIRQLDASGDLAPVYQASWGSTTRMIGAFVMAHGDNKGLVLPPQIAPTQVVVVPAWRNETDRAEITEAAARISSGLPARSGMAERAEGERLGALRYAYEKAGTPVQILVGARELAAGAASVYTRHSGETAQVPLEELSSHIPLLLNGIARSLYEKARVEQESRVVSVISKAELVEAVNAGNFARAGWMGSVEDEKQLKADTGITLRVHLDEADTEADPLTGKPGRATLFAKSY